MTPKDDGGDEVQRSLQSVQLDAEKQIVGEEALQVPQIPRHILQTIRLLQLYPPHPSQSGPRAKFLWPQGVRTRHLSHRRSLHV